MKRRPGQRLRRNIILLVLGLGALLAGVALGAWLTRDTRPLHISAAQNTGCMRHRVLEEEGHTRLEVISTQVYQSNILLVTTTLIYGQDGFIVAEQVKDQPRRAIAALTALDRMLARREWSEPAIDEAYLVLGEELSMSGTPNSCPKLVDQMIVVEALNLKLIQLAALREEDDPEQLRTRRFMRESFASIVDRVKPSPHSGSYEAALLPLLDDPERACRELQSVAEQQSGFLEALALSSHGQIRYAPADLCVRLG